MLLLLLLLLLRDEEAKVFSLRIGAWKALEGSAKRAKTRSVKEMARKVVGMEIIVFFVYERLEG